MPRVIHISDLHIGARLGRHSQNEDIKKSLDFVADFASAEKADAVVIAGDVFDTYNPSSDSEDIYYNFLARIEDAGAKAIIIPGNHDSADRLLAPAGLLRRHGIFIPRPESGACETFELALGGQKVSFVALPYVYESLQAGQAMTGGEEGADNYTARFCSILEGAVGSAASSNIVVLCHLFVKNCEASGSERNITLGGANLVDFSRMPAGVAYYAFGHLHRCQAVAQNARYSGSLVPVSIDEAAFDKKLIFFEIGDGELLRCEEIVIPRYSGYRKIEGSFGYVIGEIGKMGNAYVSLVFNEVLSLGAQEELHKAARARNIRIVSCSFAIAGADTFETVREDFSKLSLSELFGKFIDGRGGDRERLIARFASVLSKLEGRR